MFPGCFFSLCRADQHSSKLIHSLLHKTTAPLWEGVCPGSQHLLPDVSAHPCQQALCQVIARICDVHARGPDPLLCWQACVGLCLVNEHTCCKACTCVADCHLWPCCCVGSHRPRQESRRTMAEHVAVHRTRLAALLLAVWHHHRVAPRGSHEGLSPLQRTESPSSAHHWLAPLGSSALAVQNRHMVLNNVLLTVKMMSNYSSR